MMRASEPLILRIHQDQWPFSMDLIPYCSFPNKEMIKLCHGITSLEESFYADPSNKKFVDEMQGREPCLACKYAKKCNGFPQSYVEYFGPSVMKPIL